MKSCKARKKVRRIYRNEIVGGSIEKVVGGDWASGEISG